MWAHRVLEESAVGLILVKVDQHGKQRGPMLHYPIEYFFHELYMGVCLVTTLMSCGGLFPQ